MIIFTCITIVILLQVLMFVQNCTPQVNGILLSAEISITYFVLSLISLLTLVGAVEAVSYGMKSLIFWWRIILLVYGAILFILAIVIFVVEVQRLEKSVQESWSAMSQYQKDFFDEDIKKLESQRLLNTMLVGGFTLFVGILFIIIGGLCFKLYVECNDRI